MRPIGWKLLNVSYYYFYSPFFVQSVAWIEARKMTVLETVAGQADMDNKRSNLVWTRAFAAVIKHVYAIEVIVRFFILKCDNSAWEQGYAKSRHAFIFMGLGQ